MAYFYIDGHLLKVSLSSFSPMKLFCSLKLMTLTNNIFTSVVKFEKGNQLPLVAVLFSTINFIGLEKESPIKTDITKARINRSSIPFARMIR